jgi:hypothetical protein
MDAIFGSTYGGNVMYVEATELERDIPADPRRCVPSGAYLTTCPIELSGQCRKAYAFELPLSKTGCEHHFAPQSNLRYHRVSTTDPYTKFTG